MDTETKKMTMEEQNKAEVAKAQEVRGKVHAVAKLFGMKADGIGERPETEWQVRESLEAATGEGIFIRADKYGKWRLEISGEFPRNKKGEYVRPYGYGEKPHSITVASEKTPEQIAQDIKRRFLPRYNELLAKVRAQIEKDDNYRTQVIANMERLKGSKLNSDEMRGEKLYLHETVRVYPDSVRFEFMSVSIDQAEKILAILAEGKKS